MDSAAEERCEWCELQLCLTRRCSGGRGEMGGAVCERHLDPLVRWCSDEAGTGLRFAEHEPEPRMRR